MTFFTGEYETKLDAKGRLALPSRIKAQLPAVEDGGAQELIIRKGFEPCLMFYPMAEFQKNIFPKISALSEFNEEHRKLKRNLHAGFEAVELDASGRFLIPKIMLTYAQLDKDVMLIGCGDMVEAWNRSVYEKHQIKEQSELSKLAEKYLMG